MQLVLDMPLMCLSVFSPCLVLIIWCSAGSMLRAQLEDMHMLLVTMVDADIFCRHCACL